MAVLTNPKHEQFALLVARGLSATKAYVQAGYSAHGARQSAHALLKHEDILLRISELRQEISKRTVAAIGGRPVAEIKARVQEWQDRWEQTRDALDAIIAERAEEMGGLQSDDGAEPLYVAGGSTGYIMKDYKGKNAEVTVYRVDAGIIQLMRVLLDIGKRAAMELGQWQHKEAISLADEEEEPDISGFSPEELKTWGQLFEKAYPKPTAIH